jgi:hypothetical protein
MSDRIAAPLPEWPELRPGMIFMMAALSGAERAKLYRARRDANRYAVRVDIDAALIEALIDRDMLTEAGALDMRVVGRALERVLAEWLKNSCVTSLRTATPDRANHHRHGHQDSDARHEAPAGSRARSDRP